MKRSLLCLLVLAICPCLLHANGDPVISYSANIRSCNPVPLKVSDVQVVREDLRIDVKLPYTSVKVAYRLKNSSAKPIHVDYGFPVDFDGRVNDAPGLTGDDMTESLTEVGVAGRAVRDVHFRLDGAELPWTRSDTVVKLDEFEEDGETYIIDVCRLWTYTVLDIPAGATVTLEVNYSVLCSWSTGLGMLSVSPLSRYFLDEASFNYDFTPARHWGNGKAGEISVTLDCSAMPAGFLHSESPGIYDDRYVRSGNVWKFAAKDFDFTEDETIAVRFYRNYSDTAREYPSWGDPLKNCAIPASDYRLSVSGAQDKYPSANLQDGDLSTAWVAPGDGVGATVEIVFPQPRRVSDIVLWNGYHKSASLWSSNSRIKRLRLEVTRADGYKDEPVETDLTDWSYGSYTLCEEEAPAFGRPSLLTVSNLYRSLYGRELGADEDGIYQYDKVSEEADRVASIRMTVLEVVPGTKYKDLCLSDLVVLDGFIDLSEK